MTAFPPAAPAPHRPTGASALAEDGHADLSSPAPAPLEVGKHLGFFLATVASVFLAGAQYRGTWLPSALPNGSSGLADGTVSISQILTSLASGWPFAVPLLLILLFHEFGHYFAARIHRVDASLPFFIPMPFLSPFGTMGAVISLRGRIRSRNALLDIGASGPLAGMLIALPVLIVGLAQSEVRAITGHGVQEGQSLLYLAIKRMVLGPIPDGFDVFLNPTAFAGWVGLFVTALNLLPIGQLDGGHVAYALFGKVQDRYGRRLHWGLLGIFLASLAYFMWPTLMHSASALRGPAPNFNDLLMQAISNSMFWLVWFVILRFMLASSGFEHPPTEPGELSPKRRIVAIATLALFVLLFMPAPWTSY
jgi:membrane-associated protease RseP (regulator of RpoE activity)